VLQEKRIDSEFVFTLHNIADGNWNTPNGKKGEFAYLVAILRDRTKKNRAGIPKIRPVFPRTNFGLFAVLGTMFIRLGIIESIHGQWILSPTNHPVPCYPA